MKLSESTQIGIGIVGLAIAYMALGGKGEGGTGGSGIDLPFIFPTSTGLAPEVAPDVVSVPSIPSYDKKGSYTPPAVTEQSFPGKSGWSVISEYTTGSKGSTYAPVTPTTQPGTSGWSTVSSYTTGSSGSSSKKSSTPVGSASTASVMRSISSGIKRGL